MEVRLKLEKTLFALIKVPTKMFATKLQNRIAWSRNYDEPDGWIILMTNEIDQADNESNLIKRFHLLIPIHHPHRNSEIKLLQNFGDKVHA